MPAPAISPALTVRLYTVSPQLLYYSITQPLTNKQMYFCFQYSLTTDSSFCNMSGILVSSRRSRSDCGMDLKNQCCFIVSTQSMVYFWLESFSSFYILYSIRLFICRQKVQLSCPYWQELCVISRWQSRIEQAALVDWIRFMISRQEILISQSRQDCASLRFCFDYSITLVWRQESQGRFWHAYSHYLRPSKYVEITSQSKVTPLQIQEQAQGPIRGLFLSQQQIEKKQGLWMCEMRYYQELRGSSAESMSILTASMSILMLSEEHWLSQNFYQRMPFKITQNLFLTQSIKASSNQSQTLSESKFYLIFLNYFSVMIYLSLILTQLSLMNSFNSGKPIWFSTLGQLAFSTYFFFPISVILCPSSTSHYFMNLMKNFSLASDLLHNPIFLITQLQVGAWIINVKKAQPEVLNKLNILKVGFRVGLDDRIRVKAIPMAPLKPAYVRAPTYFHFRPQPSFLSLGRKVTIDKNLHSCIQRYRQTNLWMLPISSTLMNSGFRNCSPTTTPPRIKITDSAMKIQIFQKFSTTSCVSGPILVFPNAAIYSPNATNAIMPLILIPKSMYSAVKYNKQHAATVTFNVSTGLCLTRQISCDETTPKTAPRTIAPRVNSRNKRPMNKGGGAEPLTSYRLIVNNIIQVPSLRRLSPQINELNFLGAPAYFSNASTATVSVQDNTDPNMKAYGHVQQLSSYWMMTLIDTMMKAALRKTDGKARINICRACFLNTYQSELKALSNISGGRKISKIPWGSICATAWMDSPSTPRLLEKQPSTMLIRKRVGVQGIRGQVVRSLRTNTAIVRPKKKKSSTSTSEEQKPSIMTLQLLQLQFLELKNKQSISDDDTLSINQKLYKHNQALILQSSEITYVKVLAVMLKQRALFKHNWHATEHQPFYPCKLVIFSPDVPPEHLPHFLVHRYCSIMQTVSMFLTLNTPSLPFFMFLSLSVIGRQLMYIGLVVQIDTFVRHVRAQSAAPAPDHMCRDLLDLLLLS